jgi:ligand-binding sensor domain-containing protein
VYAATNEGVFRSSDSGTSWESRSTGLPPGATVTCLAVDPFDTASIFAGVDSDTYQGVYRSTDVGLSWSPLSTGMGQQIINKLEADPGTHGHLLAGTRSGVWEIEIVAELFSDGFESGDSSAWSVTID